MKFIEEKLGCSANIIGHGAWDMEQGHEHEEVACKSRSSLTELAMLSKLLDTADDTAIYEITGYAQCGISNIKIRISSSN